MKLEARLERHAGWVIFAVAFALRLFYLVESSDNPTFFAPIIDSETYSDLARAALRDGHISAACFWQPFFYQAFLVACYAVSHGSLLFAKFLQVLVGAATCVVTYQLARRLLPLRPALLAGLIAAAYGPLIFYDGELLATGWEAFLAPALLLCLLDARSAPSLRRFAVLGFASALSVLTRPTYVPFVAVACLWALWPQHQAADASPRRRLPLQAATLLLAMLLPLVPVAALSHRETASWSLLPTSGGINLYIGNNPNSDHTVAIRPGWEWDNLTLLPARHGIRPGRETSRFFTHQVFKYVRTYPLDFARGLGRKAVQFLSTRELPRNVSMYEARRWSGLLSVLVWKFGPIGFPFGLLLPLALLGLWHFGRRAPLPLHLFLVLYPASVILVFVSSRYRTPVIPVLIVCAAAGLAQLGLWWGSNRRALIRAGLGSVAVLLAASVFGPFPQELNNYGAEMYFCLGGRHAREGNAAAAVPLLQEALRLRPAYPDAHNSLGVAFERLGREADAMAQYRLAVAGDPYNLTARTNLAGALHRAKQYAEAARHYRRAAELAPHNAAIRGRLALELIAQGKTDAAIPVFYEALSIAPEDASLHNNLGSALNQTGDSKAAAQHFQAAILLNPDLNVAVDNLGQVLTASGSIAQARLLYHAALERAAQRHQSERIHELEIKLAALGEGRQHESRTMPIGNSKAAPHAPGSDRTNRPSGKASYKK